MFSFGGPNDSFKWLYYFVFVGYGFDGFGGAERPLMIV